MNCRFFKDLASTFMESQDEQEKCCLKTELRRKQLINGLLIRPIDCRIKRGIQDSVFMLTGSGLEV